MGEWLPAKLTEGASILGLFVMGALVNKWTHVNIPLVVSRITDQTGKEHVTTVQTILDQLMPGPVPLLLTFACMWLLRKKLTRCGSSLASSSSVSLVTLAACWDCKTVVHYRGLLAPFFIWRINDNHGPGTDSFHRHTPGLRDLRSVHHARRNGPTLLAIPLLRRGRIDSVIFVGLIVILIYNNVTNHGALITTWLLSALALMGFIYSGSAFRRSFFKQKVFLRQCLD